MKHKYFGWTLPRATYRLSGCEIIPVNVEAAVIIIVVTENKDESERECRNASAFTVISSASSRFSSWFPLSLTFGWISLVLRLADWDKGGEAPNARLIDLCSSIFRDGTCLFEKTKNPKRLFSKDKAEFALVFCLCVISSAALSHDLTLPPSILPTCLHDKQTHPAPSLPSPACSWVGAALCRITEGHRALTCRNTTPKEGGIYICTVGLLFSSNHGEKTFSASSCLLFSSFSPVVTLLSFICRAHTANHPSRHWRHYLSGEVKWQQETNQSPLAVLCSVFRLG